MSSDPTGADGGGYGAGPLTARWAAGTVRDGLRAWQPFPTITDRAAWDRVPDEVAAPVRAAAAEAATTDWPQLPLRLWTGYLRTGDREGFETPYFERRRQLVELVCRALLTGSVDDPTTDRLWALCEETTWCLPPHDRLPDPDAPRQQLARTLPDPATPVPDLFAAQTGAQLALARHVLRPALDELDPYLAQRLADEVDRRVVAPYLARDDWWWFGRVQPKINNWNPWINLNVLVAGLLVVTDPDRRADLVHRAGRSLDAYLACMPVDGGCTEGQSYWAVAAAKVLEAVLVVRDATGVDATDLPQLVAAARYPLAMHVHGPLMVQHADGPGRWGNEPHLLHRYGRAVGNHDLVRLAAHLRGWEHGGPGRITNLWDRLHPLVDSSWWAPAGTDGPDDRPDQPQPAPYPGLSWFATTEVLSVRQHPGRVDGLFLVAKGGHNDEEHNHNDVGSFSLALDGVPLVVDAGVNTYTGQTFGPHRYDLWTMQSGWHNLPVVNGHDQAPGRQFRATDVEVTGVDGPAGADGAARVGIAMELAGAWRDAAGLRSWRRALLLDRAAGTVELTDRWDLAVADRLTLGLLVSTEPVLDDGATMVGDLRVDHPGLAASVEVQPIPPGDRIEPTWGSRLWRLVLAPPSVPAQGSWTLRFSRRS